MKRELHPEKFFTKEEEERIINAIKQAEKQTSGEIRVHIAKRILGDPVKAAIKIFEKIGMTNTKERNGVLILIGLKSKKIAVIGDKGIHQKVGEHFWNDVIKIITEEFKKGNFVEGLEKGILKIGEKLKEFFPYKQDDVNELPDEISKD